jgi:hypothetical protein
MFFDCPDLSQLVVDWAPVECLGGAWAFLFFRRFSSQYPFCDVLTLYPPRFLIPRAGSEIARKETGIIGFERFKEGVPLQGVLALMKRFMSFI